MTKKEKRRKKEEVGEFLLLSSMGVVHVGEKPSPFTRHMPDDNWYKCYSRRGVLAFSFHTHPIFTDSLFYAKSSRISLLCGIRRGEDPLIAMFRKLRFTWSIAGGGKNAKGMLKGMGGKENGMVLDARV